MVRSYRINTYEDDERTGSNKQNLPATFKQTERLNRKPCLKRSPVEVQGGAEPTDTFQMVIDNIRKEGKICETVYKYVQVCYLLPTDYKLIF